MAVDWYHGRLCLCVSVRMCNTICTAVSNSLCANGIMLPCVQMTTSSISFLIGSEGPGSPLSHVVWAEQTRCSQLRVREEMPYCTGVWHKEETWFSLMEPVSPWLSSCVRGHGHWLTKKCERKIPFLSLDTLPFKKRSTFFNYTTTSLVLVP